MIKDPLLSISSFKIC